MNYNFLYKKLVTPGGAERLLINLYRELKLKGHSVKILTFGINWEDDFFDEINKDDVVEIFGNTFTKLLNLRSYLKSNHRSPRKDRGAARISFTSPKGTRFQSCNQEENSASTSIQLGSKWNRTQPQGPRVFEQERNDERRLDLASLWQLGLETVKRGR